MENKQFVANWAELIKDNVEFIVPANNYDVSHDERLLIPFMRYNKIGFVNQQAVPVVEPKYDIIRGDVKKDSDFVIVGMRYTYGFPRSNGEVKTYDKYKLGLLDSKGTVFLECEYSEIFVSDDNRYITLRTYGQNIGVQGYYVVDRNGNEIIPYGEYGYIDGFTNGYARIKKNNKWGIIDTKGNVALPAEYDEIWNFYNWQNLNSCRVIKKGEVERRFNFITGQLESDVY